MLQLKIQRRKLEIRIAALAIPILIYFIWGFWGFKGLWVPGKYDTSKQQYLIFWGVFGENSELPCFGGACRIIGYTPFKRGGLIDTTGTVIIPFKYEMVSFPYYENDKLIFAADLSGNFGAIDKENNIIIPFEYDQQIDLPMGNNKVKSNYVNYGKGGFSRSKKGKYALFNNFGKQIVPPEYSKIRLLYQEWDSTFRQWCYIPTPLFIAEQGTYSYLVKANGQKTRYDFIAVQVKQLDSRKEHGLRISGVKTKDLAEDLWTINEMNKVMIDAQDKQEKVNINHQTNLPVWYGLYDSDGTEILPLDYTYIAPIKFMGDDLQHVRRFDQQGLFSVHNKCFIIPMNNQEIVTVSDDIEEKLPLFRVTNLATSQTVYKDLNGATLLSSNADILEIHNMRASSEFSYLIFSRKGKKYRLMYDYIHNKWIWNLLEK